jgi:hypothetical protein
LFTDGSARFRTPQRLKARGINPQALRRHPIAPTKFPTGLAATQEVRRWKAPSLSAT